LYLINQQMSSSKEGDIYKYLSIAGGLGLVYVALKYLEQRKSSPQSNSIPLDRAHRILQEIKYQVFTNCISFS